MDTKSRATETTQILPLLRSIAREIRDRTEAVRALEKRRAAFEGTPTIHAEDLRLVDAALAAHRRELRRVEKELARLGCSVDEDDPLRILVPREGRAYTFSWHLDDTQFRPRPFADSVT